MPRRKRHFVFCKKGLHRLPPPYSTKCNNTGLKKQPRRVGDGSNTYVARQCEECMKNVKGKI